MSDMPDISTRLAKRLAPRLDEVEESISHEMHEGMTEAGSADLVASVIHRLGKVDRRRRVPDPDDSRGQYERGHDETSEYRSVSAGRSWLYGPQIWLGDVIDYLAQMPSLADVVDALSDEDLTQLVQIHVAARRLSDLAEAWPSESQALSA